MLQSKDVLPSVTSNPTPFQPLPYALGRPSTRSPMMFFWISDVPE